MARIFVSFHHELNQEHADLIREQIVSLGHQDISVNDGTKIENEEYKTDEQIRVEIRDKFLRNVDITVLIVGSDIKNRKHLDWEIRSTMQKFNHGRNAGIIVINALAEPNNQTWILNRNLINIHDSENNRSWQYDKKQLLQLFDWLPERLKNSMLNNFDLSSSKVGIHKHAVFPIISYEKVKYNQNILKFAIEQALEHKESNFGKWDTNTKMKRQNNESSRREFYAQIK